MLDGLRFYPVELLNTATSYVGQTMVIALLSPETVGIFAVSLGVSRLLEIVYGTISTILLPAAAARPQDQVVKMTLRAGRLTLALLSLIAIPLIVIAPLLVPLLYGRDFAPAGLIAQCLLLEVVFSGTTTILLQAFIALARPEIVSVVQTANLAVVSALLLAFVPSQGVVCAAAILLFMALARLGFLIVMYRAVLGVPVWINSVRPD